MGFPDSSVVKNPLANAGDAGSIPGSGRSPEKEMATHSSILAWEIPWTEEPKKFGHDLPTKQQGRGAISNLILLNDKVPSWKWGKILFKG